MVLLHVKKREESLFLYETSVTTNVSEILPKLVSLHNGRRKVLRLAGEMEELAKYGVTMKLEMQGLTEDQIRDLKLVDEYEEKCTPSGGFSFEKDPCQRRTGRAPIANMKEVLRKAVEESKEKLNQVKNTPIKDRDIADCLAILSGACSIVYPMGLPPYDPIRLEFENCEDLSETQESKELLEPQATILWFTTKQMQLDKKLQDYFGTNEKTKVIVKLTKSGSGPPAREPRLSEEARKELMLKEHRRREEIKAMIKEDDDSYLHQEWADTKGLAKSLQGVGNLSWKP